MLLGTALTGLFSVVAQILVPLADPSRRGKVVGTIMSGLLLGILLARTAAGALADRGKAKITTLSGLLLFSWALVWYGQYHWLSLVLGIIVLDLAAQGLHITNQSVIYRCMPEALNHLTSGYMTSYFAGGAFCSLVSATAYQNASWNGVSLAGGLLCLVNLLLWLRGSHHEDAGLPGA